MTSTGLSIVIPSWNGRDLLAHYLPSVDVEARRWEAATGGCCEIIISDDGSTDGTAEWLSLHFPRVRVARSHHNRGFAPATNAGIQSARQPIVVLLNNDLELLPGALDALPGWFEDPDVFGVTLRGLDVPGLQFGTGGKLGRLRRGFWEVWRNYDSPPESSARQPLPSFSIVGGFCALRRSMFLQLSGFDTLFAPYYWEDVDLSYRARKRGWKTLYEPRSVVHHAISASVSRHSRRFRREAIIHRNRLLFHWKNLDGDNLRRHLLWAHLLLLQMVFKLEFSYHAGYVQALQNLAAVRAYREREKPNWRRRDEDLAVVETPAAAL